MTCTEDTLFYKLFFSDENVKEIQRNIRQKVFIKSKFNIGDQTGPQLKELMKITFDESRLFTNEKKEITENLRALNNLVASKSADIIIPNIVSDITYKEKLKTGTKRDFLALPEQVDTPRYNNLEIGPR
jgi:hypothetical protein